MNDGMVYLTNLTSDAPYGQSMITDRPPQRIIFVRDNPDGSTEMWEGTLTVDQLWAAVKDRLDYTRKGGPSGDVVALRDRDGEVQVSNV